MSKTRVYIFENKDIHNDFDEYILDSIVNYSIKDVNNYQFPIIDIDEDDNIIQNESDIINLSEEYLKEDILNIKSNISEIKNCSSKFNSDNNFVYNINFREEATLGLSENMQDGIKTLEKTDNESDAIEDIINDENTDVVELSGLDIDNILARHLYTDPKNNEWAFKKQIPENINADLNKEWEYQNKNIDTTEVNFEHEFNKNESVLNNEVIKNKINDIHELLNDNEAGLLVNDDTLSQIENNIENAIINSDHINEIPQIHFLDDDEDIAVDEDILKQIELGAIEEKDELLEEVIDNPKTISNSFLEDDDDISIDDETLSSIENTLKSQDEINIEYINEDEVNQDESDLKDNKDEFPIDEIYEKNIVEVADDTSSGSFNGEFTQDNLDNAIKRYEDGVDNSIHLAKEVDVIVSLYDANRLSNMLSFIDNIIKELPEDKQSEFAKSEHYDTYIYFVKKINNL